VAASAKQLPLHQSIDQDARGGSETTQVVPITWTLRMGLGRKLSLGDVTCPVYLLAGHDDDITMPEQVFNAEKYLGTPRRDIKKATAPGGHIGLFMGHQTLNENWPSIARWIAHAD
jgi:poly(3-hydroxyalkanoate) synthetase